MSAEKQSADTLYYHFAQQLTKIKIKEETTISYLVCHMEKYHKQEVWTIEEENERYETFETDNPQIDSKRTKTIII